MGDTQDELSRPQKVGDMVIFRALCALKDESGAMTTPGTTTLVPARITADRGNGRFDLVDNQGGVWLNREAGGGVEEFMAQREYRPKPYDRFAKAYPGIRWESESGDVRINGGGPLWRKADGTYVAPISEAVACDVLMNAMMRNEPLHSSWASNCASLNDSAMEFRGRIATVSSYPSFATLFAARPDQPRPDAWHKIRLSIRTWDKLMREAAFDSEDSWEDVGPHIGHYLTPKTPEPPHPDLLRDLVK